VQRVAGSIGNALLAVVVQRSIASRVPGFDGSIQEAARSHTAEPLAAAFGTTFRVAFALVATALVPALLLPRGAR